MAIDKVSEVAFYPIKGARAALVAGEVPQALHVGATGFEMHGVYDRDYVLFDPNADSFISQRGWSGGGRRARYPQDRRLATVQVDVRRDHVAVESQIGRLEIGAEASGRRRTIDIFGKQFPAVEQAPQAAAYFSRLLEREVLLLRADREHPRVLPEPYQREGAINQVAGADGRPFLLVSEASLALAHQENKMEPGTVPIDRYRGNLVIAGSGLGSFGEDFIDPQVPFQVGDIGMWVVKACARCPVPDIDQTTGEIAGKGLQVLRGRAGKTSTGESGIFFGQNVVHANQGMIAVGDRVVVESFAPDPNIMFRDA